MGNSGQSDHKNNNDNNASKPADARNHEENVNSEHGGANSKSNNNDPFDFEEFLKFENIGDFLSVSITYAVGWMQSSWKVHDLLY